MININKERKIEIFDVKPVYQNGKIAYFNTNITIKEIGQTYKKLTYDGNAQRGFDDNSIEKKPLIDKKHVDKIKDSILNGGKVRGHLTWNIRATDELNDMKCRLIRDIIKESNLNNRVDCKKGEY